MVRNEKVLRRAGEQKCSVAYGRRLNQKIKLAGSRNTLGSQEEEDEA